MNVTKSAPKTNAARTLDRLGIRYELKSYPVDKEHRSASEVAELVGMDPATVFKTLLAEGDRHGLCFAVLPATQDLDLKALARASDNRRMTLVPLKQVQPLTGYVRGGVTALAAKKELSVFLHASAAEHDRIAVSAGSKGLQLVLHPDDYVSATKATLF